MAKLMGGMGPHPSSRGRHRHWPYLLAVTQAKQGKHQKAKQPSPGRKRTQRDEQHGSEGEKREREPTTEALTLGNVVAAVTYPRAPLIRVARHHHRLRLGDDQRGRHGAV